MNDTVFTFWDTCAYVGFLGCSFYTSGRKKNTRKIVYSNWSTSQRKRFLKEQDVNLSLVQGSLGQHATPEMVFLSETTKLKAPLLNLRPTEGAGALLGSLPSYTIQTVARKA